MTSIRTVSSYFMDLIEKARRGPKPVIGEIRVFGGRKYIYAYLAEDGGKAGWKYYGSGKGGKASSYHVEGVTKHPDEHPTSKPSAVDTPSVPRSAAPAPGEPHAKMAAPSTSPRRAKMEEATSKEKEPTLEEVTKDPHAETYAKVRKDLKALKDAGSKLDDPEHLEAIEDAIFRDFDSTTSDLGGSSEVKLMVIDGQKYAVKQARNRDEGDSQIVHEALADSLYETMGIPSPESKAIVSDGKYYKVSKFIEGGRTLGDASAPVKKAAIAELKKHFVIDALLGNWDVVGANEDNIVIAGGHAVRIDNGGSLKHRARGAIKSSSDWGLSATNVQEITSMRKGIFADVTDDEIRDQVALLKHFAPDLLNKVSEFANLYPHQIDSHLKDVLAKRIESLQEKYPPKDASKASKSKVEDYDKSLYASATTARYAKEFEALDINIHDNYKTNFLAHAKKLEESNKHIYMRYAEERGVSVDEYKDMLQSHVEKLMQKSEFFRATDLGVLDKILLDPKDARFKSQFETASSHGSYSPTSRAHAEHSYFGWKNDTGVDRQLRPIYGYCSDNTNGINNRFGTNPPSNNASQYGGITLKINKEHALKHATVTFGDSLGMTSTYAASPVAKPHFTSLGMDSGDPLNNMLSTGRRSSYTEIQYHNQLKAEHIDSVHISLASAAESSYGAKQVEQALQIARKTHLDFKFY